MFCLAVVLSYTDRQILSLLVEYLRRDLQYSDTQISLLQGMAFVFFYVLMGFPIGRLVDNSNRVNIIAIGIVVWSFMTGLCGIFKEFWLLFAARAGVGVGEAALNPSVYSLLPDYFEEEKIGRAGSIIAMGSTIGAGIALFVAGAIIELTSSVDEFVLPVIGTIFNWQLTFFVVGLPGLLFALVLYLSVKEPPRRQFLQNQYSINANVSSASISEVVGYLNDNIKTLVLYSLGFGFGSLSAFAIVNWVPAYFIRLHGWSPGSTGVYFGIAIICASIAGVWTGGVLADWLSRRKHRDSKPKVGMIAAACYVLPIACFPFTSNPWIAMLLVAIAFYFCAWLFPVGPVGLPITMPNEMRGQAMAVYFFIVILVGLGCGPTGVALLTDYLFRNPDSVGYSVSVIAGIGGIGSCICLGFALRPYRRSLDHLENWVKVCARS